MKKSRKILITGGAGFIGSHVVLAAVARGDEVVNLDALTYAANLANLRAVEGAKNYKFVRGDIRDQKLVSELFESEKFDAVLHLAAESHVDFSIKKPDLFVETNVLGTQNLLDAARNFGVKKFVHISTDEVYGELSAEDSPFTENSPIRPNSPYSASKAGADLLVRAGVETFDFPAVITRCSNNFGPHQDASKLLPKVILNALAGRKIPIFGEGENVRDWLFVRDHVRAIFVALDRGRVGEIYNIGGNNEWKNLDLVREVLKILGKSEDLIEFVADRPGHDFRYAIDASKIQRELGWSPSGDFEKMLAETVDFFANS